MSSARPVVKRGGTRWLPRDLVTPSTRRKSARPPNRQSPDAAAPGDSSFTGCGTRSASGGRSGTADLTLESAVSPGQETGTLCAESRAPHPAV